VFANAIRAFFWTVDPMGSRHILVYWVWRPLLTISIPIGLATTLLVANVWKRACSLGRGRGAAFPAPVVFSIALIAFFDLSTSLVGAARVSFGAGAALLYTSSAALLSLSQLGVGLFFLAEGRKVVNRLAMGASSVKSSDEGEQGMTSSRRKVILDMTRQVTLSGGCMIWFVVFMSMMGTSVKQQPTWFMVGIWNIMVSTTLISYTQVKALIGPLLVRRGKVAMHDDDKATARSSRVASDSSDFESESSGSSTGAESSTGSKIATSDLGLDSSGASSSSDGFTSGGDASEFSSTGSSMASSIAADDNLVAAPADGATIVGVGGGGAAATVLSGGSSS